MNDTRPEPKPFIRPRGAVVMPRRSYTARERAAMRGWSVDWAKNPAPPHAFGAKCVDPRCSHRGRGVIHYRRGR